MDKDKKITHSSSPIFSTHWFCIDSLVYIFNPQSFEIEMVGVKGHRNMRGVQNRAAMYPMKKYHGIIKVKWVLCKDFMLSNKLGRNLWSIKI
jgi:hypothetical protein